MLELKIPEIYWDDKKAVRLLVEYFPRRRSSGDLFYSGAHFERLGGGGDAEHAADRFDSNDLVAITTLSASLEPHGAINLLTDPDGHWVLLLSQQLGDVVAVSAGQRHRERDALAVGEDVVLAARSCAVDRAGAAFGPRRAARTWEESITARDQSSFFAARSFFSSTRCSASQTPASFQAARRRQHVIPEPKPSSWGRYSYWMPVCSTNRIPHSACRSGTRGLPSTCLGPGSGSNGSMSDHSSSDTTQGRDCRFPTNGPTTTQA